MRQKSSEKSKLKIVLVIFLVLTLATYMLFQVWLKVQVRLIVGEIERLNKDAIKLREENNQYQAQVTDLSSYERITQIAQGELGMIFLKQDVLALNK